MGDTYRVIKMITTGFGSNATSTTEVVWEGTDLDELSRRFPRSEVMGADELGHHEIEDGYLRWDHRFQMREDGEWRETEDPRHAIRDARQAALEAAIDAENRRNFPGDYLDDDDDFDDLEDEEANW